MAKKPFFSIIIPTLNEEKYLPKLLKALSKQSYTNFEVIIVDANSEDRTQEVAKKFAVKFPFFCILTSSKKNVSHQRNLGAKNAKGKFFVFFDADVTIPPQFLEGVHYSIISRKLLFITTWLEPDSKASIDHLMLFMTNVGTELAKSIGKPFIGGFDIIVHRDVFCKIKGFREDLPIAEDHDFAIRANKSGYELAVLKDPRLVVSLRRLRSEGTLQVVRKYTKASLYTFLKVPITKELFDYPMGGHVHKKRRKKKINLTKFNNYLKRIQKLQRKMIGLL